MKTILRFLGLGFYILTSINPLLAQWVPTNGPNSPVVSLAVIGTNLYAGTTDARGLGGVYVSTAADPTNWSGINSGLASRHMTVLGVHNSVLFAGTYPGPAAYRYAAGTWEALSMGNQTYVWTFGSQDTRLFAGTYLLGANRSENGGDSWIEVNTGLQHSLSVQCFAVLGSYLFAGTSDSGVYRSNDYGANWTRMSSGLTDRNVYAFAVIDTIILASMPGNSSFSVYRSANRGATWVPLNVTSQYPPIWQFLVSGQRIFAAVLAGGVFVSDDRGATWSQVNAGIPAGKQITAIAIRGDKIYAGTTYDGSSNGVVYSRPLSEITDVHESTSKPTEFRLDQNYPNPFNPATNISFSLASKSFVSLKVFDALGREVSILASEEMPAGTYSRQWNGEGVASGIYFYRLQAGSFMQTKKIILLR